MNWREVAVMVALVAALLGITVWLGSTTEALRQYEVTLGDGTKATCIVVQGYRSAGVTCVPHIVMGPDAEEVP